MCPAGLDNQHAGDETADIAQPSVSWKAAMISPTTTAVRLLARHCHGDQHDAIVLVRRAAGETLAGQWELPGGKVDPDEQHDPNAPMLALARETREETGLTLVGPGIHRTTKHFLSPSGKQIEAHLIECITIGQVTLSEEHDDYLFWQPGQPLPMPMTTLSSAVLQEFATV
jgi:8-oxo-dGTP pyrophosphatase MutT (NUDIX family)